MRQKNKEPSLTYTARRDCSAGTNQIDLTAFSAPSAQTGQGDFFMRVLSGSAILEFLKAAFSNMNKSGGQKLLTLTMHIAKINEKN